MTRIIKPLILISILIILSGCGIYKPVDARKIPSEGKERAKNHKNLLFSNIDSFLITSPLINNIVTNGIWNPTIEEKYNPVIKPIHDFKRQVEDSPESIASWDK